MTKLWQEFKAFAFKGNMIELAIAVVVGAAFGKVIDSLVKNIIMPAIGYIAPNPDSYRGWTVGALLVGQFLADLVSFLVVAVAVFILLVKLLGTIRKMGHSTPAPAEPTTKECPLCLSVIPIKARRCAHCTADLDSAEPKAPTAE